MNICSMKGAMSEEQKQQLTDQTLANQTPADQTPATMPPKNPKIAEEVEITNSMVHEIHKMLVTKIKIAGHKLLKIFIENSEVTETNNKIIKDSINFLKELEIPKPDFELIANVQKFYENENSFDCILFKLFIILAKDYLKEHSPTAE